MPIMQFKVPGKSNPPRTYSFPSGFAGGINISVNADLVQANQSPDMQNMNYDSGSVPTKRYGFSRVNAVPMDELLEVLPEDPEEELPEEPEEEPETPEIPEEEPEEPEEPLEKSSIQGMYEFYPIGSDEPIFLIAHGGKLYSYDEEADLFTDLCTGDVESFNDTGRLSFIVMGGKCFFLTGNEYLYYDGENPVDTVQSIAWIPTTVMGKKPDGTGGVPNEKFNHLSQKWKESFSADGTSAEFVLGKFDDVELDDSSLWKAWVYGEEKEENTDFTVDRTEWKITFNDAPLMGTDNVVIQLEAKDLMDESVITNCTRMVEFGGKNDSVIFMTGNPDYPNTNRYSWVYDPTYFPEDYDFNVGGDSRSISGWGRMREYLITYKQPGDHALQWYSDITIDLLGDIAFETYILNDEYGCVAPHTVKSAQNGLLAFSDEGVIWTWPTIIKGQANCKIISQNINGKNGIAKGLLDNTADDLKNAVAAKHDNKYYLHVGDKTWVLDLNYSDLEQGITCWYPYTNILGIAYVFMRRDNRLYLGSKNGLIYKQKLKTDLSTTEIYTEDNVKYGIRDTFYDAYWTSPAIYGGGREWIKKFERLLPTFRPEYAPSDVIVTLITDRGDENFIISIDATYFNYNFVYYDRFSYGIEAEVPFTQGEKLGHKGEYLQWRFSSGWDNPEFNFSYCNFDYGKFDYDNPFFNGMTILSQTLQYSNLKMIK